MCASVSVCVCGCMCVLKTLCEPLNFSLEFHVGSLNHCSNKLVNGWPCIPACTLVLLLGFECSLKVSLYRF